MEGRRFLPETTEVLYRSGWKPGRNIDISAWIEEWDRCGIQAHQAARDFLEEFAEISVDISGPGISLARAPFEFTLDECIGEEDRFLEWSEELGRSIYPIGIIEGGIFFLGIDENSEIYHVQTWVASDGRMPTAMDNLVTGVKPVEVSG